MPIKNNQEEAVCAKESTDILDNLAKSPQPLVEGNILFHMMLFLNFQNLH